MPELIQVSRTASYRISLNIWDLMDLLNDILDKEWGAPGRAQNIKKSLMATSRHVSTGIVEANVSSNRNQQSTTHPSEGQNQPTYSNGGTSTGMSWLSTEQDGCFLTNLCQKISTNGRKILARLEPQLDSQGSEKLVSSTIRNWRSSAALFRKCWNHSPDDLMEDVGFNAFLDGPERCIRQSSPPSTMRIIAKCFMPTCWCSEKSWNVFVKK